MNLKRTGRILAWFLSDLRTIAKHPGVTIRELPLQVEPYRPPGLWAITQPAPGCPLLWRFPQPLHPLEVIASLRGFGGLENTNIMSGAPSDPRIIALAEARAKPWLEYTQTLAPFLFVPPGTLRIVWHLLTPLNIPSVGINEFGWEEGEEWETDKLWGALGFPTTPGRIPWMPAHLSYIFGHCSLALRPQFWTHEIGDAEL